MAELVDGHPERVLAVYAHPDDADVACAGTLAKWAAAGADIHLVVCTDGGRGTFDAAVQPADLAAQRREELEQAVKLVGLSSFEVLGMGDGDLEPDRDLVATMVALVRRHRPDAVFGHDPTAVFFGQEYFNHHDHRAAGWALLDALSPAAALPHYFPEAGPPHQASAAYLSGTLEPDVWVDITDTVEVKVAAVECHRTQFASGPGPEGWVAGVVRSRAEDEGRRAGVTFAEGFRRLTLRG